MHSVKKVSTEIELEVAKRDTQTETNIDVKDEETQTAREETCLCREKDVDNEVHIKQDRAIFILRKATFSEEEWGHYKEKVQSEI